PPRRPDLSREPLARSRPPGGAPDRGPVRRLEPGHLAEPALHRQRRRDRTVAVSWHRPAQRVTVRQVRGRDRRQDAGFPAGDGGAGDDSGRLRARQDRRDDLLRAPERREGLRCGNDQLSAAAPAAARAAAAREPLGAVAPALTLYPGG